MAESQVVANQTLKKLEDQLTCAICLDAFKDPKLLQCFHVYCKDCLQRLVVQDQQGQLSLCCPTCRQSTLLPPTATDASGLQSAFHIHHLFEIQDALKKVKDPQNIQCEKCTKTARSATNFCRDCGKFICEMCSTMHSEWEDMSHHEVVSIKQLQNNVKQLVPPKKIIMYCSVHKGKELELYCETCEELICLHCTINKHCRPEHKYDLVDDTFERHEVEIKASLEPVGKLRSTTINALEQLAVRSQELDNQQATTEANICQQIKQLHEVLEARKEELVVQLGQHMQVKRKNLAIQKDELETALTQLDCLLYVTDSLKTGSQAEIMKIKKSVMKQIKEKTDNFKPDKLPPCESANVKFTSPLLTQASQLQQFGEVYLQQPSPEQCFAKGNSLQVVEQHERATAVVHIVDNIGNACTTPLETVTCELVSEMTGEKTDCSVKRIEATQCEISYQPNNQGRHKLHIKVNGEHIEGSPFAINVKLLIQKLGTPIKMTGGLKAPVGVAINCRGEIIVAEYGGHCVSIFSPTGDKILSFGSEGSGQGQLCNPRFVMVNEDDKILVADTGNNRIQNFTSDGQFIVAVGKKGNSNLEFNSPRGITFNPSNKKIYIVDRNNDRIQIVNHDLTFSGSFGSNGSDNGQFNHPCHVACDSTGIVYVTDTNNHRIQVFTADGKFLRKFGKEGNGKGELKFPVGISINSDNVVYVIDRYNHRVSVFTCEGKHLTSFGTEGSGPGQLRWPCGIAVDKSGVVYVSDTSNNRLQLF